MQSGVIFARNGLPIEAPLPRIIFGRATSTRHCFLHIVRVIVDEVFSII